MENIKDIFFDINFINDVIDGLVDDVTAAEFFEHIDECENCRRAYEEAFKIRETMKQDGFLPGTENMPSADFAEKTMAKIRAAKKPLIIRIISHPAVKTAAAAVAVLLIAVFVFRSDLFGKIDGANGLAGEMIASDTRETGKSANEEEVVFSVEVPEEPKEMEDEVESGLYTAYNVETAEVTTDFEAGSITEGADDIFNGGYTESYIPPEMPMAEEGTVIEEEQAESSAKNAYDQSAVTEEAANAAVPEFEPAASSGYAFSAEEPDFAEEEMPEDAVITEESVTTATTTEYIETPETRAVYGLYATGKDTETARAVAEILAKDKLGGGVYTRIILVLQNYEEDFPIDPNIYEKIGQTEYDGYIYTAYECTVYGGNDTAAADFGSSAMEIFPEIYSEYEDKEILLVLFRTDK